jgi:hypothetical protein
MNNTNFLIFGHLNFGIVSNWSETDATPDIRISNFMTPSHRRSVL